MPETRYRMTNDPSRVFDSRLSERPGAGFPSCGTELCRMPRNTADPHGYYAELGVDPWATDEEIKIRVRALYRRLHPDTGAIPNPDKLQRVKLVAEVLLDPEARERYNRTPPGKRLLDRVYRSELSAFDFTDMDPVEVQKLLRPPPPPPVRPNPRWYDYLAVDRRYGDMHLAQRWYAALVATAALVGYRRRIKVLLQDGPAFFHPDTSVMGIPRFWQPSKPVAFALWTVVAGQRHPAWRE